MKRFGPCRERERDRGRRGWGGDADGAELGTSTSGDGSDGVVWVTIDVEWSARQWFLFFTMRASGVSGATRCKRATRVDGSVRAAGRPY